MSSTEHTPTTSLTTQPVDAPRSTPIPPRAEARYLVWSHEHRGWWKARGFGYTRVLAEAGHFPAEYAAKICDQGLVGWSGRGLPPEVMVEAPLEAIAAVEALVKARVDEATKAAQSARLAGDREQP